MWIKIALSLLINGAITIGGYKKKSLSLDGAIAGAFVGIAHCLVGFIPLISLLLFFASSSYLTKRGAAVKKKVEDGYKKGGQRNWLQVFCNGGPQAILCLIYLAIAGFDEIPIDFQNHFFASSLILGVVGGYACANGDTWASECGILSEGPVLLATSLKKVPRGTNGGLSAYGTAASFFGGAFIGFGLFVVSGLATGAFFWRNILFGALMGLGGSLIDSFLGATVQYSGWNSQSNKVVNEPGPNVRHITGIDLISNHTVNLVAVCAASVLAMVVAPYLYP